MSARPLALSDDELSTCVGCGLCLPHCPTFRVTNEEALSPRGRIATIRSIQYEGLNIDAQVSEILNTCVQCRGCEPACPSGVPYGRLIEAAKNEMARQHRSTPWWQRFGLRLLRHHRLLLIGTPILAVAQRLRLIPKRAGLSRLPLRLGPPVVATSPTPDVWLFTGCVMDAWQRSTHRSVAALIEAAGLTYGTPTRAGSCCGALHSHAGLTVEAQTLAKSVMTSMPGTSPIVVDSAGCGAALKDYGHLLGTPEAHTFSQRVFDIHEWLEPHMATIMQSRDTASIDSLIKPSVIVQDPCHLRHVQKTHLAVRSILSPVVNLIELDDDGLCCGAGGAYSVVEPELAGQIRDRKVSNIRAKSPTANTLVASANPGCLMHLQAAGLVVKHPVDILAEALGLVPTTDRSPTKGSTKS
jgi:glycolate oxidase iron-sulfur subunit